MRGYSHAPEQSPECAVPAPYRDPCIVAHDESVTGDLLATGAVRTPLTARLMGGSIISAARHTWHATGAPSGEAERWHDASEAIAIEIDDVLRLHLPNGATRGRLGRDFTALDDLRPFLEQWVDKGLSYVNAALLDANLVTRAELQASTERLDALRTATRALSQHRPGWARWVELQPERPDAAPTDRPWVIGVAAPVSGTA